MTLPAATPVTTPLDMPTDATAALLLLQVPDEISLRIAVVPGQMLTAPDGLIAEGFELTSTVVVA